MTIATGARRVPSTSSTKPSSIMGLTAGRPITGGMSCTRLASGVGESASNGGTNTGVAGIMIVIGMIATTRPRPLGEDQRAPRRSSAARINPETACLPTSRLPGLNEGRPCWRQSSAAGAQTLCRKGRDSPRPQRPRKQPRRKSVAKFDRRPSRSARGRRRRPARG